MTLRGTVRHGKVELDAGASLPEGTRVEVEPTGSESLLDLARHYAAPDPGLPKDYAAELDHYLYGMPKRNGKRSAKAAKTSKKTQRSRQSQSRKGR